MLLVGAIGSWANSGPRTLDAFKTSKPPVIDGAIGAEEWQGAAHGEGFFEMKSGKLCPEKAEFWIAYDAKFVYFAGRAHTDPTKIVADEYRQNVSLAGNDSFLLALDAANSGQDIDLFRVNAQGATNLRLSGGRAAKTEWLGEFDAKGRKTPDGWEVEARVPWGLITRPKAGVRDVVFNMLWLRSADGNGYEWELTNGGYENYPKLKGIEIPDIAPDHSIKLLPYGYVGAEKEKPGIFNAGLDFKTNVRDSLTLVGTVNPDFRNIENAILNLDHSYFERLADDARPFFQEGSRFRDQGFDYKTFASQRVGDFDLGVNIYGAPTPKSQLSAISTMNFGEQGIFAGNFQQRVDDYRIWNVAYARDDNGAITNDAMSGLYDWRAGKTEYYIHGMFSNDSITKSGSRAAFGGVMQDGGRNFTFEISQVTPDFMPRLGFAPEVDLRGGTASYGITQQMAKGPLKNFADTLTGAYFTHMDGSPYRWEANNQFTFNTNSNWAGAVVADVSRFEGSDDFYIQFKAGHPVINIYRGFGLGGTVGRFQGVAYKEAHASVNYRPTKRMQLNAKAQWVSYTPDQRQIILTANYDLGHYDALAGRLVQQDGEWNWYLSYRMSGKKGNEFFVILGDPNATQFKKSLVLKAVMPVKF